MYSVECWVAYLGDIEGCGIYSGNWKYISRHDTRRRGLIVLLWYFKMQEMLIKRTVILGKLYLGITAAN